MIFKNKKIKYKELILDWFEYKKDYVKESTYANYSNIISNHIIKDLGEYYLSQINNKLLQKYLLEKYKNGRLDGKGGLGQKTLKDIMAIIKSSLKYAAKEELINSLDLDFVYPKSIKKDKVYTLSIANQNKLIDYVLAHKTSKSIGILLALYSGMRIGELCALKWQDIDFSKNLIYINKTLQRVYIKDNGNNYSKLITTTPKTHNAERVIPINKEFAIELKKFKTNNNCYVLSGTEKGIEPRTYRRFFESVLKKSKIKQINFHGLRHTFATNCIKHGVDYKTVSELLGHATVNITLNLYVHPQLSQKKKCINLISKNFLKKL